MQEYSPFANELHNPLFWHGLEAHPVAWKFWQFGPLKPKGHIQVYGKSSSFEAIHEPPFLHGKLRHGLLLWQYDPAKLDGHEHFMVLVEK